MDPDSYLHVANTTPYLPRDGKTVVNATNNPRLVNLSFCLKLTLMNSHRINRQQISLSVWGLVILCLGAAGSTSRRLQIADNHMNRGQVERGRYDRIPGCLGGERRAVSVRIVADRSRQNYVRNTLYAANQNLTTHHM